MFSEYASKFLAQSQSRISFASPQDQNFGGKPRRNNSQAQRRHLGEYAGHNTKTSNRHRQFGFYSRVDTQAPLLHSLEDDEEDRDDEEQEHEREVADYFALQRSRKHFVRGRLDESLESEENHKGDVVGPLNLSRPGKMHIAIKSSWLGDEGVDHRIKQEMLPKHDRNSASSPERSTNTLKSVSLDYAENRRTSSPIDGQWTSNAVDSSQTPFQDHQSFLPMSTTSSKEEYPPRYLESASESTQGPLKQAAVASHDTFWGTIYILSMAAFFSTSTLVWLHTSNPSNHPLGDTVYSVIRKSYRMLIIDTFVAVIVSLLWLTALRSHARHLVYTILLGVPSTLFIFSIYPFVASFTSDSRVSKMQSTAMRWLSLAPLVFGGCWLYGIYRARHAFWRSIDLLELATKVLASYPPLLLVGMCTLAATVLWSWLWIGIFTRVFLGGHFTSNWYFVIDMGSWWLGGLYVLVYLWTLNVMSGVQRATTAASVSQWYFHRLSVPSVPADAVVRAALSHALTTCFGTICLSTLLALMVRLPALLLPKRIVAIMSVFSLALVPESVSILTNPMTMTHAAVHSQPLSEAARILCQSTFLPSKTRRDGRFEKSSKGLKSRPHQLALLLLYATRLTASLSFGFGAWIHASRQKSLQPSRHPYGGSLYGYIVGMIAGMIGWSVTGAVEGVLASIVDAIVACWESEVVAGKGSQYCREAELILGGHSEPSTIESDAESLLHT